MKTQIVSISGSQGCGKTSTIAELGKAHQYANDSISIPRFVQKQHGAATLADILSRTPAQIKQYQSDILEAKLERDLKNKATDTAAGVIIVERNFADIYAFATQWARDSGNEDFIEWVATEYKAKCIDYQRQVDYLSCVLMPLPTFEADPRRASESSRFDIHERILDFLDTDLPQSKLDRKWFMIGTETVAERAKRIHDQVESRIFGRVYFPNGLFTQAV